MERHYEDVQVGEEYESPARTVTEADIVNFPARVRVKILSKRETKKPDVGIVVEYVTMLNQRGEIVQEGRHGLMVLRNCVA